MYFITKNKPARKKRVRNRVGAGRFSAGAEDATAACHDHAERAAEPRAALEKARRGRGGDAILRTLPLLIMA